jgi:hypothetical protein
MMGPKRVALASLFYRFSVEDHVASDHPLRRIDRFVDLSDIRQLLALYYSSTRRPSINPDLAFMQATLRGYRYAAENPQEAAGILIEATEGMLSNPELVRALCRRRRRRNGDRPSLSEHSD